MEALQQFLTQYSGFQSYLIYCAMLVASCVGLFNSDIVFITAGALSGMGFFDYRLLILLGWASIVSGDSITFFAGRKWGRSLTRRKPFSLVLNDEKMDIAENFFRRKGVVVIFFIRFLPLLRTALFITSGSLKADPKKFYALNACSTLIYSYLVIIGCNRASAHADEIVVALKKFQFLPLAVLLLVVAVFCLKKKKTKPEGVA